MWPHSLDPWCSHGIVHIVRSCINKSVIDSLRVFMQVWQLPCLLWKTGEICPLGIFWQRPSIEKMYLLCPGVFSLPAYFYRITRLLQESIERKCNSVEQQIATVAACITCMAIDTLLMAKHAPKRLDRINPLLVQTRSATIYADSSVA